MAAVLLAMLLSTKKLETAREISSLACPDLCPPFLTILLLDLMAGPAILVVWQHPLKCRNSPRTQIHHGVNLQFSLAIVYQGWKNR